MIYSYYIHSPKMFTATRGQVTTYLVAVCLGSISFLVFVNASISFVITTNIGEKDGVGNAVGSLGFADEVIAIVACPLWGLLSDYVGARPVLFLLPSYCRASSERDRYASWRTRSSALHLSCSSRLEMYFPNCSWSDSYSALELPVRPQ